MAAPTGTFQTYQAIGNREDLSDVIHNISPMDTPFVANAKKATATHTFHEWQTDALAAHSNTNKHIEGDDTASDTATPTVRIANYTQILKKIPRVAGTQEAMNSAGRKSEMSYQIAKRGKELKRDLEAACLGLQAAAAGNATTARSMAGIGLYFSENEVVSGSGSSTPALTSGAPTTAATAGTDGAVTEADLKDVISNCWDNGGNVNVVFCGTTDKKLISAFGGIATQYKDNNEGPATIIGAADVYVSDFGTHQIVANRFQPSDNIYALDMEQMSVAYLRPYQVEDLAKTGDSMRKELLVEATVAVLAPASSGKIFTTTG